MENVWVYPYKMASESGKALAAALECKRIKREGSRFKGRVGRVVVNWGNAVAPEAMKGVRFLNHPAAVAVATNKLSTFNRLYGEGVPIPAYTTLRVVARDWLKDNKMVVCRTILNGKGGAGIVLVKPGEELVRAALYTQYVPGSLEYRVHVVGDEISTMIRRKKEGFEGEVNPHIRNHDQGYEFKWVIFEPPPEAVVKAAVDAVKTLGLDFGAVDIRYSPRNKVVAVLEVNTAPGMARKSTVDWYVNGIKKLLDN